LLRAWLHAGAAVRGIAALCMYLQCWLIVGAGAMHLHKDKGRAA
jgi:hypothetical protein